MKDVIPLLVQLVFLATVFATCDNRNGRDLWDAAIDYVDSQGECGRPEVPYTIKHNSEIK